MRTIAITLVITRLLWSCTTTEENINYSHQLKKNSNIEFYVGPKLYPSCKAVYRFNHEGQEILAYVNRGLDILFFSINDQKQVYEINYKQDGPNKISSIRGVYVHNMDSIVLLTTDPNILNVSDSLGNILKKIKIPQLKHEDNISTYISNIQQVNNPVIEIDQKLHFSTTTEAMPVTDKSQSPSMGISYNFLNDTIESIDVFYPSSIDLSYEGSWLYSRDYDNIKWVYSFIFSNELMAVDKKGNIQIHSAKSKFAGRKHSFKGTQTNDLFKEILKPRYSSIFYDKWRDVFYRIFLTEIDFKKSLSDEDYYDLIENPQGFSVMILSKDLEVIGETLMPERYYNPEMCFIDKSGLHFALHINHPDFDPDYLKFANFIIEPIKDNQ